MKESEDRISKACETVLDALPPSEELREWTSLYARKQTHRLAEDLRMVRQMVGRDARILECGGAPYILTVALRQAEFNVTSLDIQPDRYDKLITDAQLDVQAVDFETEPLPFPDESFDLILFNEVFEHLRIDLIATMTEVRRVLRPGGTLLLSTPNHRSVVGIWTLLWHQFGAHAEPDLYRQYQKLRTFGHMGHVREYTARDVSMFLGKVGLRTMKTIFRFRGPPPARTPAWLIRSTIEKVVGVPFPGLRPLFTLVCRKSKPDGRR